MERCRHTEEEQEEALQRRPGSAGHDAAQVMFLKDSSRREISR